MKKNVLKVLLAFVIVAMMFAFAACGGGDKTPKCTNHVDEDCNGKCDVCEKEVKCEGKNGLGHVYGDDDVCKRCKEPKPEQEADLADEVNKIFTTLDPYLKALTGAKKDSNIGVDIGIEGFFEQGKAEEKKKGSVGLALAANASATNPELKLGVSVSDKEYFALGYKAAALYLLEGLNMINTDEKTSNKIKMDVAYLEDGVKNAAGVGMEYLEWFVGNKLKDFDLNSLKKGITEPDDNGGAPIINMVKGIIKATSKENEATLSISKENMVEIVKLVKGIIGDNWATMESTVDNVISQVANVLKKGAIYDAIKDLTVAKILDAEDGYLPALEIRAGYENDAIKSLKVVLVIEKLNLELGLNIKLNVLSLEKNATVDFSGYKAQNLKTSVKLDLDNKGLSGVLDLAIHTGDAFKTLNSNIASARLKINDTANAATAVFNGDTVYLEMAKAFTALGVAEPTVPTAYKYVMSENEGKNIKEYVLAALNGMTYTEPTETPANASEDQEDIGIWGTIYNFIKGEGGSKDTTANDVIDAALVWADSKVGNYLKFKLVDNDKKPLKLEVIGASITAIHTANKAILEDAVNADGEKKIAGAQLIGAGEGTGLLDYVAKFIRIPSVKGEKGSRELDFDNAAEINDKAALKAYVLYAFETFGGDSDNSDYVYKIVGVNYGKIIDDGVYVYAGANKGLDGYVGAKASKDAKDRYVEIGGAIKFVQTGDANFASVPGDAALAAATEFNATENDGGYTIWTSTKALWDAFLAYTKAA